MAKTTKNGVILPTQMFVGIIVIPIVEIKKRLHKWQHAHIPSLDGVVSDGIRMNHIDQIISR